MGAVANGGQWTISATAASISTILGISPGIRCQQISIRNKTGAANALYVGNSDVTNSPANAHLEIPAGYTEYLYSHQGWTLNTDEIYLVGTANASNIAFINCVT